MNKILTIIGARPQFIKAASLSKVFLEEHLEDVTEDILHTGQHYDENMSNVFFDELNIPKPIFHFDMQDYSQSEQFSKMYENIAEILTDHVYDAVLVYGDTNSTLAGALASAKKNIPVIHIEAGLRSNNKSMPEEINRILTDHCSSMLFCPTQTAIDNLKLESIVDSDKVKIFKTGDIMYDSALNFAALIEKNKEKYMNKFEIREDFILCTVHRDFNTDSPRNLLKIFEALDNISKKNKIKIILPTHPRTDKMLRQEEYSKCSNIIESNDYIETIKPVSYPEMLFLEKQASFIMTDSGGVQKEAYFFEKKCIVLRPETEWVEIIDQGCAALAHSSAFEIAEKYQWFVQADKPKFPQIFGTGKSAEFMAEKIVEFLA